MNIENVNVLPLKSDKNRLIVLRDDDHLLRRFGQVEVRTVSPGEETEYTIRGEADEIWVFLEGEGTFHLVDRRKDSPTENNSDAVYLGRKSNNALFIPFGVAYSITVTESSSLIRVCTHRDGSHPEDKITTAEFLGVG